MCIHDCCNTCCIQHVVVHSIKLTRLLVKHEVIIKCVGDDICIPYSIYKLLTFIQAKVNCDFIFLFQI